jgi:hypothetical protein
VRREGIRSPYVIGKPRGLVALGNIDLYHRPIARTPGGIATVRSISISDDQGRGILIPTVINGRVVSDMAARSHYLKTGQHLGVFKNWQLADRYARVLHLQQQQTYR